MAIASRLISCKSLMTCARLASGRTYVLLLPLYLASPVSACWPTIVMASAIHLIVRARVAFATYEDHWSVDNSIRRTIVNTRDRAGCGATSQQPSLSIIISGGKILFSASRLCPFTPPCPTAIRALFGVDWIEVEHDHIEVSCPLLMSASKASLNNHLD